MSLLLTGLALCIYSTEAFLTDRDMLENEITVGMNYTEIQEEFPDPGPFEPEENPQYRKTVWVANTSVNGTSVDCYVRMSLSFSSEDIAKAATLTGLDTDNWIYDEGDGYYYYRHVLREGEKTTPLFTGVSIDRNYINSDYLDKEAEFSINVYEESIQSGEFTDYRSAWEYYKTQINTSERTVEA